MYSGFMTLFVFIFALSSFSCKENDPHPSDITGNYLVTASLVKGAIDKEAIRDSIKAAIHGAKADLAKAKTEMEKEMDIENLDTTTTDGKIEYGAKKFAKSITEISFDMGKLGDNMGNLFANLADEGVNLSETILKNINMEVDLLPDGKVNTSGTWLSLGLKNAEWKVENDYFLLKTENDVSLDTFFIKNKSQQGFVLEKDKLQLSFVKQTK